MKKKYRSRKSAGASILSDTASVAASGTPFKVFLFGIFSFVFLYFGFPFFIEALVARNEDAGIMHGVAVVLERRSMWAERLGMAILLLCSAFAAYRKLTGREVGKKGQKVSIVAAKAASRSISRNT